MVVALAAATATATADHVLVFWLRLANSKWTVAAIILLPKLQRPKSLSAGAATWLHVLNAFFLPA